MTDPLPPETLKRIVVNGFKSIESCDLELGPRNILIGANGAGKSNFLGLFRMLFHAQQGNFQSFVVNQGGPDMIVHRGRRITPEMSISLYLTSLTYTVEWRVAQNNLAFVAENIHTKTGVSSTFSGGMDSAIFLGRTVPIPHDVIPDSTPIVRETLKNWRLFHFQDTSEVAAIKQWRAIHDNLFLRPDAANLAPFLYRIKTQHPIYYYRIVSTVRLVAPFFEDFILEPDPTSPGMIELRWRERDNDNPYRAYQLSDGTLRFACLATLFLQPEELLPSLILVDEPELGLHPLAISILAGLIRSSSVSRQVIVTTQSVELLNEFEVSDIVVVDRTHSGASTFHRLDANRLQVWLEEYSLGQLWLANHLGGRPA